MKIIQKYQRKSGLLGHGKDKAWAKTGGSKSSKDTF